MDKHNNNSRAVVRLYLGLTLLSGLAASLVRGVDALFLIDAGLSISEVFIAYTFLTVGMVFFEIPTGVLADTRGRKLSYIIGTGILAVTTALYLLLWQIGSGVFGFSVIMLLFGLGFTFFSGATEAWVVDALKATNFKGKTEHIFARSEVMNGIAMLGGVVLGGILAEVFSITAPYVLRTLLLTITLIVAIVFMHDLGFKPQKGRGILAEMKKITTDSVTYGLKQSRVRNLILIGLPMFGIAGFMFYAMQPYLLNLYGSESAYFIAGLATAIVAGAQIVGGLLVEPLQKVISNRRLMIILGIVTASVSTVTIGILDSFYGAIACISIWAISLSIIAPIRQSMLNEEIPSERRATVLSFGALIGSSGGIVGQPTLGRLADAAGMPVAFIASGIIQLLALPFAAMIRRSNKD